MNAVMLRHYVVRYEFIKARAVIVNHAAVSVQDYRTIFKCYIT